MKCPICGNNDNNSIFLVKELGIGLRDEFEYVECNNCGCLFIKNIPNDISRYYDAEYIPHNQRSSIKEKFVDKIWGLYLSNNKLINLMFGDKVRVIHFKIINELVSKKIINKTSAILDVGCGNGSFLKTLKRGGFKDLTGMDLFIDENNMMEGIQIFKSSLEDFSPKKKYDFIVSNHSFEHMDNQLKNLKCFENLIKDSGIIMIRIPVKSDYFWEKYGVNWYQIDAPRHFFLHTLKSFEILCNQTNLIIEDVIFDALPIVFIYSEAYKKDISSRDKEWTDFINSSNYGKFEKKIGELNEKNNGDQAIFLLRLK